MHETALLTRHDPLRHLEKSQRITYRKGAVIYDATSSPRLYLVVSGRVHVFHTGTGGRNVPLQLVEPDGLFGDAGLWSSDLLGQSAVAATQSEVMSWAGPRAAAART
jgi:CRP-like cAMP-binding protein